MDGFTLRRKTFLKTAGFFGVFWLFIFVPAWPPDFWEGWVYWLSFLLPMVVITLYFLKRDPDLIWRRISTGPAAEPERRQMIVRTFAGIMYFCMLILAGLDHRRSCGRRDRAAAYGRGEVSERESSGVFGLL